MKERVVIEFIHELGDGGASALVKDYSLMLTRDGLKVVVIVVFPEHSAVTYSILENAGIEIRSVFKERSFINRVKNKLFHKYYISTFLKHTIQEIRPVAIHAHLAVLKYLSPISGVLKGCNVLFTCHSLPSINFEGKNAEEAAAAKVLLEENDLQLIALHEEMAADINQRFHIKNTEVIRNGIDFQRYRNVNTSKEKVRASLDIPQDAYVIGHVGRFSTVKNHRFLVDVFKKAKDLNEKAFLVLIGTGELIEKIKMYVAELKLVDSVLILSHRKDIPELLTAMDVFTLPSLYEGFSIATLEAQVIGLNCVVADTLPKQVYLSERLTTLSLTESKDIWATNLLNPKTNNRVYGNINDYDMNNEIKKLEALYMRGK